MGNKKHIDRLFQEKFKDFEAKPSDAVWQNIQKELNQPTKMAKPAVPFWSKWAAIAAIILVFISVGIAVFTNNTSTKHIIITDVNLEENNSKKNTNKNEKGNADNSSVTENNKIGNTVSEGVTTTITDSASYSYVKDTVNSQSVSQSNAQQLNSSTSITQTNGVNSEKTSSLTETNAISSIVSNKETNRKPNADTNEKHPNTSLKNTVLASMSSQTESQTNPASTEKTNANTIAKNPSEKNNNSLSNPYKDNTFRVKTDEELFVKGKINAVANTNLAKNNTINDTPIIESSLGESIEDAIAKLKKLKKEEEETPLNKWSVNANVAPVYYNSLGKGSSIDQQFVDNTKNGEVNMSYGVQIGYAFNDNLKLRSGVNKLDLSYDTSGVVVYQSVSIGVPDIKPLRNIDFEATQNGENISVLSTESFNVQQINNVFNDNFNAALSQRMSYIEVPLELEYALIKKRFGLNIIGGMSTFFLSDNQVVTEFDNYRTKIGEANNINDISFSTNVGLGLDYNFSKTFTFNFEPKFKYQINTYSETSGNFKPYIIGVYTGLSYKF